MALVKMTVNLIDQILANFEASFNEERAALPRYPSKWPDGIGDELYSLLLKPEEEEQIRKLFPNWWNVNNVNQTTAYYEGMGGHAKFSKAHIQPPVSPILKPPGFKWVRFDGYCFSFEVDDVEKLELPKLKETIKEYNSIKDKHAELSKRVYDDVESLRLFLEKHRTLQKAVDEFGPSLMTWVPKYQQDLFNKPVEPKKKEEPKEEIIVDLDSLRTRAINTALGLNGATTFQDSDKEDMWYTTPAPKQRSRKSANVGTSNILLPQDTSSMPKFTI